MREQSTMMNLEGRWPELFEGLSPEQIDAVVQSCAASWHAGWEPNREDVQNLVDEMTGVIDAEEYERRVLELAQARAAVACTNMLKVAAKDPEPVEGFSGATPREICQRYAAGEITRERLVDELVHFPYAKRPETDGYDWLTADVPGTWSEVCTAKRWGLIGRDVYEEVFNRQDALR